MNVRKTRGPANGKSYTENAKRRWEGQPPDWVMSLASALDAEVAGGGNQKTLNRKLRFSNSSVISAVINNTYPGPMAKPEAVVRGALMKANVQCPALGFEISRDACAQNQSAKFASCNPMRARFKAECPACPNSLKGAKA